MLLASAGWAQQLTLKKLGGKYQVNVDGQVFAELDYSTYAKPIVYPIYGPGQVPMTRNYPMVLGVSGEATDHPHQKSMWLAHGDINGVSFWDEKGKIITERVLEVDENPARPSVTLRNKLVAPDGATVAHETVSLAFSAAPDARIIDWDAKYHADDADLKFGDTKEGMMAIRTHPNLQLEGPTANGTATNSNGVTGPSIWGKAAKWVDYSGTIDGQAVGISIFDHPSNFRHPTPWHAREYGLIAANPFGLSHFIGSSQNGSHVVPKGESLRFRYRFVFHRGNAEQANVAELYEAFARSEK
jgi:hypothetical protein